MNILIIDAQGGGIGKQLIAIIKKQFPEHRLIAVGTNSAAATAMLKAGADVAATGENAVVVNSRSADVIIGPIGIVIADSLYGEITPLMAQAVAQSPAKRILIPVNRCDNIVVGVSELGLGEMLTETVSVIADLNDCCYSQRSSHHSVHQA